MAKKGESKILSRLAAPKVAKVKRKGFSYLIRPLSGMHKKDESIALAVILRDMLKIVRNAKEAKKIISRGKVKVNGVVRKEYKFAVGLFDVVEIEGLGAYRIKPCDKGYYIAEKIDEKEINEKICKIVDKKILKKIGLAAITNDGRQLKLESSKDIKVNDSVIISLPSNNIIKHLPLKENAKIFVFKGRYIGQEGKLKEIIKMKRKRNDIVVIENEKGETFSTNINNIIVVG